MTSVMEMSRARAAIRALNDRQQNYPDYDTGNWLAMIKIGTSSVQKTAKVLAAMADWSMNGIEVSQEDLASRAGISMKSVGRALRSLESTGFIVRCQRRNMKSNGFEVTQSPDVYRLCIPGGPVWGMPKPGKEVITALPEHSVDGPDTPMPAWLEDNGMAWLHDDESEDFKAGYKLYRSM